jgi:4-amino-4-deoxy-L-arabinose transferase-like glycosyltransferase
MDNARRLAVARMPLPNIVGRWSTHEFIFLGLLCLIPILLYLPFLGTPFERDEGVYATIAQGILDGKVPYRDLFDNKPPLVYLWYVLSFSLFGESVVAPRIVAAVFLSVTAVLIYHQARLVLPRGAAYSAAILFAISTGLPWVALHANTEAYMLAPLAGSLLSFTYGMKDGRLRWFFLAGVLAGLAMMTKQVAMWNLLALAMVTLIWHRRTVGTTWQAVAPTFWLFGGAMISLALVALPFALTGALDDFLYATLSYNWVYVGFLSWADRFANLGHGMLFFCAVAAPLVAGAIAGLVIIWRRRASATDYVLILWAVASAIGVASGGRFFPHYFLQLMPSAAMLTGIVVYDRFVNGRQHVLSRPAWAISLFLIVVSVGTTSVLYLAPRPAEDTFANSVYYQKEWENYSQELGDYIKLRSNPDDPIFNYGRESQVYFYADRPPAISYFNDWPVQYDKEVLPQIVADLKETRPVYIIDSLQAPLFEDWQASHPPELTQFISENYEYAGRVYFAEVYRLNEYTPPVVIDPKRIEQWGANTEGLVPY